MHKLLLITAFVVSTSACSQAPRTSDAPKLKIIDEQEKGKAGGTSDRYCLVVYGDGRFHMERRTQQSPQPFNTLTAFDSRLNVMQEHALEQILSASSLSALPAYQPPAFPMGISSFNLFHVALVKSGGTQVVGYIEWQNKEWPGSPNDAPDATKQSWQVSKTALSPFLMWVRQLESSKPPQGDTESTACN